MEKEYFKIMFAQMHLTLDYDEYKEYLVADDFYFEQMEKIVEKIAGYDVAVFPELAYHEKYDDYFLNISKDKIIVFGSKYIENNNFSVVYHNKKKFYVKKMFNSGVEPSIRYQENITVKEFMKSYLKDHVFKLRGKKFIVLNCAEYYKVAYFIARDEVKSRNLFGFLVPCANNNNEVFINESMAIHNHNGNIYSFVVNSVATYKSESYSKGGSYVFGRLSSYEREFVNQYKNKHVCNICMLDDGCFLVEGMYLCETSSNYYRSDRYRHTPKNIKIEKIGER